MVRPMRPVLLASLVLVLSAARCAPDKNTPLDEIRRLTSLAEVMDNQKAAADPQFAKVGRDTFTDDDFAAFAKSAERLQMTSLKAQDFSRGRPEFEVLTIRLGEQAKALGTAAAAKDTAGAKTALAEMNATCKECHSKFK
jgi:cytochrome c556